MKRWMMAMAVVVAFAGCDAKDDAGPSAAEQEAARRANEAVSVIPGASKDKPEAAAPAEETKQATAEVPGEVKSPANEAANAASAVGEEAKAAGLEVVAQAQKLINEGMEAVKAKDFAAAKAKVAELEKLKDKLSPELLEKLEGLKKAVQAGDIAGGVNKLLGK